MKKKIVSLCIILCLFPALTGCSVGRFIGGVFKGEPEVEEIPINDGYLYGQTSNLGVDSTKEGFLELLKDDSYYVIHEDIWYPLSLYYTGFDLSKESPTKADIARTVCLNETADTNIPTLYSTDQLVYYSTSKIIDYTVFERFKDLGWTFPIMEFYALTDGRLYLYFDHTEDVASYSILPGCPLYDVYDKDNDVHLYIDKVGGISVDNSLLNESGLFDSQYLKKGAMLDFECYRGTVYEHYSVDVNTHAFRSYEIYAQPSFIALQTYVYEIPIPDYFLSGYYMVENNGLLRYVKDTLDVDETGAPIARYPENYDFNEQLLYPKQKENAKVYDTPYRYSSLASLNLYGEYLQAEAGTFGQIDSGVTKEEEVAENAKDLLRSSYAKAYYFEFPKDRECEIIVESSTGEKTGEIVLTLDNGRELPLVYDIFNKNYNTSLTGAGEIGELYITGLFDDYSIQLKNAVQTTNPNTEISSESEDIPETTTP